VVPPADRIPRTKEPAVAASEPRTRRRRAASREPANGTVEIRRQDLQELLDALRSARDGEIGVRLPAQKSGVMGDVAKAFNGLAERREALTTELGRVSKVIGREGRMTERAQLRGAKGSWAESVDSVNSMIDDLVRPTIEVSRVLDAVAEGDLSQKMSLQIEGRPVRGEFRRIGTTVNTMLDQLSSFAAEVTRVAREVGTEGILGGQARVKGVSGIWRDLTDNVNFMANNLTTQVRNIAEVTTAVANGDLSKKITVDVKGEVLELKNTINTMVDQLSSFADEVTRVAREVGTEGILGGQAHVKGVSGTWKDLTDNVNFMATNLTSQVRGIARVVTAVATGDLNQKFTIEAKGEVAALADTINSMIDTLRVFAEQVTTVAHQVGTEGELGGQAEVPGVAGTWKALTDSVNGMAANLTDQVRNIADVTTAVATGDLTKKITVDVKGEVLELKNTINTMVDQLSSFADEVTRVATEVGTEGRLGGQAEVEDVSGTWRQLTQSVNGMASNLTDQVRNIADVTTAVAKGDLSKKITVEARGEILELKSTVNTMVDQLSSLADEVTRVAREVGTEGKLGGQAQVKGVSGTWKDLTDNVNTLAGNLTSQVRNIADVTTAVANGDLSKKITVDVKGEILELKDTINTMVDQLSSFADEVTRVAREVGTEGRLGGQADVKGVSGTWKDLTDNVNAMADNLTDQVRNIADVTTAVATGDLSKKITVEARGEVLELKETINTMVDQLRSFAAEVTRVAREVGTEGRLGGQANVEGVSGTWKNLTDSVNTLADNLTTQVRNIAEVTTAVATGDLGKKITVDVKGEILALKNTINTMVDQLSSFADEVTRVAREVGTEGKLGGQAKVKGVSGTWKDLTDNVNTLADNLTNQVRNIAEVTTAVAKGELSKKITVDARGEIQALKNTINTMVDQLSTFAAEVTRVAKEVGGEGKLGVQAQVEGVSGVWKGLTDNVNQLAGTLTTQLRAISEVSQAVTKGDLTRSIAVEAQGEVAELKDTINQMIANLGETTRTNQEQDWLNSNMARFTGMLQGERDLETVSRLIMSELTPLVGAQHGAFFMMESPDGEGDDFELRLLSSYGYKQRKNVPTKFKIGEALVGQAALELKPILITQAPDDYVRITSGLGEGVPVNVIVLPVLFEEQVMAVVELASFQRFSPIQQVFLEQLSESIGVVLNTIQANMRTEELLEQSQQLTGELQSQSEELQAQQEELQQTNKELEEQAASLKASEELLQTQQEELQQTNEELEEKAQLLEEQNRRIEIKNREIELARAALEEKAEQLALSSSYKSEFLANMSHELRTPLNSLLILAKLLAENPDQNLTGKQIEFADTIYSAGSDLLDLINDILDLSKVEAGRMDVNIGDVRLSDLRDFVERSFRPVSEDKALDFEIEVHGANVPPAIETDEQRLQQVLKNLLSNAFKFTETGSVKLRIGLAEGRQFASEALSRAEAVLEFAVTDTGVGIPHDKLRLIFEAFQQADGTTSRRYGGTGLGLSISREIARLLGGEIHVESTVGEGSTFTLFLPARFQGSEAKPRDEVAGDEVVVTPGAAGNGGAPAGAVPHEPELDPALFLPSEVRDDRDHIQQGDRVVLIVEDDAELARTELDVARERGFKGIVAMRGDSGLALAHEYKPDAIILDMNLPVMDGWAVLERLKQHPETRHIPVHIVSAGDGRQNALRAGAVAFVEKPVSKEGLEETFGAIRTFIDREVKRLLVVEDDDDQRRSVVELISADDVEVTAVASSEEALEALELQPYDCMVLDLKLPQRGGFELLEQIKQDDRFALTPVIVYTGKELTQRETTKLRKLADTIVVKDASSPERLLDETALFLHRVERKLPQEKRRLLEQLHSAEEVFKDKKIVIVDDDVRNVFALTSVLEAHGMEVLYAENGREGIELLGRTEEVDLILMDIMMPELDGYETTRAIRAEEAFKQLPIICLTAKAMKGDREKAIAAGASDYITKPVDTDQLLSLMRVWLYK
jgi:HAMP domain-containing protein/signal transduction histidine kinase/DNA-binding response OmpR family regulator